ncbi:DUF167 domain-containing protein [Candidatus Korarchaeum cryptofilum]|jgi:uncharacterized protein (TIGR00251 family)|uniref:UPF0235 protein D9Q81_06800 n=1 Tax=Candidatus Korarchaeum cryptofilum TaxID=498846 RepID=A0A429G2L6_9CREN|nr:DUF167 domain-containing protein [Candidatus Korarchaeum cryptofilum]RSN67989.1 DUF167 domain-containing protein [Candidatus Korarchaeum cryptofilum]
MRVSVLVVPNARKNGVVEEGDHLKVYVRAPPVKGKANEAVIEVLAEFFGVKKSDIRIISGERSREKVVEIRK